MNNEQNPSTESTLIITPSNLNFEPSESSGSGVFLEASQQDSQEKKSKFFLGVGLIVIVALIWVTSSELLQYIFQSLSYSKPFFTTYFNTSLFSLWGIPLYYYRKKAGEPVFSSQSPISFHSTKVLAARFCVIWFLANSTFNFSLLLTSVSSNTVISSSSTIFTLLFSYIFIYIPQKGSLSIKELMINSKFGYKLFWAILGFGGIMVLTLADQKGDAKQNQIDSHVFGDLLALSSAIFYGAYTVYLKYNIPEDEIDWKLFWFFVGIFNIVIWGPILLLFSVFSVEVFEAPSFLVFGYLCLNGIVSTVISDALWAKATVLTSPLLATIGISATLPLSILADWIFKGIGPSPYYWLGSACVFVSVIAITILEIP